MKITKREIEVNCDEFIKELYELSQLYKRNSPSTIGFSPNLIMKEFGLKMTTGDFYKVVEECKLKFTLSFIAFKTIEERYKQINNG
jgi:hypothetical protein